MRYIDDRILVIIALLCSFFLFTRPAAAACPSELNADYAYIIDYETGVILCDKQATIPMAPASMSKMMTLLLVFDALRSGAISMDEEFTVSKNAYIKGGVRSGSSTMFLNIGEKVTVEDLLRGVIVQSGNDASITLAEGLGMGSEDQFADLMNRRAQQLGLTQSYFVNATGWPHEDHKMSARDLAILSRVLISDYSEFYPLFSEKMFRWNDIIQYNRNPLLGTFGVDGLKTGHTQEAKYGLTLSAERAGRRIIMVLNGMKTDKKRRVEARRLLSWAFRTFSSHIFARPDQPLYNEQGDVLRAPLWHGTQKQVQLGVPEDFNVIMPQRAHGHMVATATYKAHMVAPIKKGEVMGELSITFPGLDTQKIPLIAQQNVARQGVMQRFISGIKYLISG